MRLLLIFILLAQASLSVGQPVLEQLPIDSLIGRRFQLTWSFETDNLTFQDPAGTFNQFFDYKNVGDEMEGPVRTWKVAADGSKHSHFPEATLCYTQNELSLERYFGLDADTTLVELGVYYDDNGTEVFMFATDPQIVALPVATYGTQYTDTIQSTYLIGGDTMLYRYIYDVSMISYGTVRTPESTYSNCLIELESQLDSLGNIHRNTYTFYHANLNNPVLNVTLRNYPSEEILYINYPNEISGPVSVADIRLYIDKASLTSDALALYLNTDQKLSVTLYDIGGKIVFHLPSRHLSGSEHIPLNMQLTVGCYILVVVDEQGYFQTEKLCVR